MVDTAMLRKIIKESGLKLFYIAERLDISAYSFTRKIENRSEFTASEIDKLCDVLNITDVNERFAIFFA